MRLFVALQIPSAVKEEISALLEQLRAASPQTSWVRSENLHVTLKFIGEAPETKLGAICDALSTIRSGRPATLDFRGLGYFPGEKHPRVLWAGIAASANLKTLASDIEHAMEGLGFPREERTFSPHLTLTRFQSPRIAEKLRAVVHENTSRDFGSLQAGEFHLVQSKLKSSGAEYTTLQSFPFAAAEA
jgi:RNA 2',3'-cyclic 3'-phosphodiesterase